MKLLITGANGFIAKHLVGYLLKSSNFNLGLVTRKKVSSPNNPRIDWHVIKNIADEVNWDEALENCEVVIHTAGRAHIIKDTAADPLYEFRRVNTEATIRLARHAAHKGVKRFIFLSTIGVHGNETLNKPIDEGTDYNPQNPYALSKVEAERELFKLAYETSMEIVVIRPPLVYAADAPGNFKSLLSLVNKNLFLPLGSIHNARSLISRENLIDFICCCIEHPAAKNQAFVICDGKDISTTSLINYLSEGMGFSTKVFPFPIKILNLCCTLLGKKAAFHQLTSSLQVDNSKARMLLNWTPKSDIKANLINVGLKYKRQLLNKPYVNCQEK